jgi:hypothetical protein
VNTPFTLQEATRQPLQLVAWRAWTVNFKPISLSHNELKESQLEIEGLVD